MKEEREKFEKLNLYTAHERSIDRCTAEGFYQAAYFIQRELLFLKEVFFLYEIYTVNIEYLHALSILFLFRFLSENTLRHFVVLVFNKFFAESNPNQLLLFYLIHLINMTYRIL